MSTTAPPPIVIPLAVAAFCISFSQFELILLRHCIDNHLDNTLLLVFVSVVLLTLAPPPLITATIYEA